jgi:transcriptional regulator with XRE-family HTH domain
VKNHNRIGRLMQSKGVSETQLAISSGMAESALNRIKNGKVNPTIRTAHRICRALGVTLDQAFPVGGE